jgi:hypothetical protein
MNKRRAHEIRPVVLTPRPTAKILRFGIGLSLFEIERPDLLGEMTVGIRTDATPFVRESECRAASPKMASLVDLIVKHITPHVRRCATPQSAGIFLRVSVC